MIDEASIDESVKCLDVMNIFLFMSDGTSEEDQSVKS